MTVQFTKATKWQARLRMAIQGPAGSGKTYTSLCFGCALAEMRGGRLAVIDTERGSAVKYADRYDFDVVALESFQPERYVEAIDAAEAAGYRVLVIDSLSHAWEGEGGVLSLVDEASRRTASAPLHPLGGTRSSFEIRAYFGAPVTCFKRQDLGACASGLLATQQVRPRTLARN